MSMSQIISIVWTIIVAVLYVYLSHRLHTVLKKDSVMIQVIFVVAVFIVAGAGMYFTEMLVASVPVRNFILPVWYCLPIGYAGYFFETGRRK